MIEDGKYTRQFFSPRVSYSRKVFLMNTCMVLYRSPVSFKCDNSSCQWCGINSTGPLSHISLSANRQLLTGWNITHLILCHTSACYIKTDSSSSVLYVRHEPATKTHLTQVHNLFFLKTTTLALHVVPQLSETGEKSLSSGSFRHKALTSLTVL